MPPRKTTSTEPHKETLNEKKRDGTYDEPPDRSAEEVETEFGTNAIWNTGITALEYIYDEVHSIMFACRYTKRNPCTNYPLLAVDTY